MRQGRLYCCYSLPQREYLKSNDVKYEVVALNEKTKCTMWIYIKDEKLNSLLDKWSQGSKS